MTDSAKRIPASHSIAIAQVIEITCVVNRRRHHRIFHIIYVVIVIPFISFAMSCLISLCCLNGIIDNRAGALNGICLCSWTKNINMNKSIETKKGRTPNSESNVTCRPVHKIYSK